MEYPIQGSCQCGQVTYQLLEPPQKVIACHCRQCQTLATGPFSVTAIVPAHAIQFSGDLKEWGRYAESGNKNYGKFCPTCGNRIYHYNPDTPEVIKLKLKPLETGFEPTMHIWVSEKQAWYQIPDDMPAYEKQA